jgi:hypothetical protein
VRPNLSRRQIISFLGLFLLLLTLSFSLGLVRKVQYYLTEALGQPANIVVDASIDQGPITPIWRALAQGGEEKNPFENIINEIAPLKPRYIRLDHIYDFYDVVRKEKWGYYRSPN